MLRITMFSKTLRRVFSSWGFVPRSDLDELATENKRMFDNMINAGFRAIHAEKEAEKQREAADKLTADNQELRERVDNLTRDLMQTARSESMATERAWHAVELAKILQARIDAGRTSPGGQN